MALYIILTLALMLVLFVSITDRKSIPDIELYTGNNIVFSKRIHDIIFVSLLFTFWFLTAFRSSNIGNDTFEYLSYYEYIGKNGVNPNFQIEKGYQYFNLLLSQINPDPYFLLLVCATICYVACGIYIYKNSKNILLSTILLFCVAFPFFASGLRQSIAMVIVLFAYPLIKKGKILIPILLILVAAQLHISALVALLWFIRKYIPKKPSFVIPTAVCVAILSASGILNGVLSIVLKEYKNYFESENAGTGWLGIFYYCLRAVVFFVLIYVAYKDTLENSLEISNAVLLLLTVCLGFSVNLFNRASLYYLLVATIDIPNAFNSGKMKNRDVLMLGMGVIMLAYFLVTLIARPEWNNLYPYEFWWD